jgi:hypothetical protein
LVLQVGAFDEFADQELDGPHHQQPIITKKLVAADGKETAG